jgi:hypothetical protein
MCANCDNGDDTGKKGTIYSVSPSPKRKRLNLSPYKKKKSADFLAEHGTHPKDGPWTMHETCLLYCILSLINGTSVSPSLENITLLYNNVIESKDRGLDKECSYFIRIKTKAQMSAKLRNLDDKGEITKALLN